MSDPDSKSGVFSLSSKNRFASGSDSKSILRLAQHVFAIKWKFELNLKNLKNSLKNEIQE